MKKALTPSLAFALIACGAVEQTPDLAPAPTPIYRSADRMVPFPSDRFLVEEEFPTDTAEGGTGYRVHIEVPDDPALKYFSGVAEGLADMDGFGTSADIAIAFTSIPIIPENLLDETSAFAASVEAQSPIRLIVVEPDESDPEAPAAGTLHPFTARIETDGRTLFLRPWVPLQPKTRYAVVFHKGLRDVTGREFEAPRAFLRNYRSGQGLGLEGAGYRALRKVISREPLFAITFRTASIHSFLKDRLAELTEAPTGFTYTTTVSTRSDWLHTAYVVEGSFIHRNYRDKRGRLHATVQAEERIPISITIPKGAGPFPIILGQHGLGDIRQAVHRFSDKLAEAGFATVSIDAPEHGDRLTRVVNRRPQLDTPRDVLGVWTDGNFIELRSWQFRDVIRQQAIDHHQVIRLVKNLVLDFDGDGQNDIDAERLGYTGQSMGGIIGGVSAAVNTELERVLLNVPGGRLHNIVTQNGVIGQLAVQFMRPPLTATAADVGRMFAMYQTVLDPGDPINYIDLINRPKSGLAPRPLLIQAALNDGTVPNSTTFDLVRAANATLVGPVFDNIADLPSLKPAGQEKLPDVSLSFFQWLKKGSDTILADHGNVWASDTGVMQAIPFFKEGIIVPPQIVPAPNP